MKSRLLVRNYLRMKLSFWFMLEDIYDNLTGNEFGWYPSYESEVQFAEVMRKSRHKKVKIIDFGDYDYIRDVIG